MVLCDRCHEPSAKTVYTNIPAQNGVGSIGMTLCSHCAHRAFEEADARWSAVLRERFGKQAGDKRYTAEGCGEPDSRLQFLHDEFIRTQKEWRKSLDH